MKSLGVYLKHYKKESIIAPLFKLLEVVFDLLVPMVTYSDLFTFVIMLCAVITLVINIMHKK